MPLFERLTELVRACFAGLWIQTHEQDDAIAEISQLCRQEGWSLGTWDIDRGLAIGGQSRANEAPGTADPLTALRAAPTLSSTEGAGLLLLKNFHRFLGSPEIVQALAHQIVLGKQTRTFVVILAPVVTLPAELEKLFLVLEHELPGRQQLTEIAQGIATEPGEWPAGLERERILDAASGLTRYEAEGAFSLALVRHGRIEPETLWQLKAQTLVKNGLLALYRGGDSFTELGGLDSLKAFCLRALRPRGATEGNQRPRGVLLLGVPGTGKSAFCKALGNETGRPTLTLDVGALFGSLVGQTEERTRHALRIADAMSPAVLMVDEIEKALSGATGAGAGDSGVSSRMLGSLLTWLNDHTSDVFTVCTANDISRLPPEFTRAGRFDGVFFLDLPDRAQKDRIWEMHLGAFALDRDQRRPDDAQWTGAEIRACCRLAALLDVPLLQAAQNVVPVAVTASESVDRLRSWAAGRCLSADHAGLYRRDEPAGPRRSVSRKPSSN